MAQGGARPGMVASARLRKGKRCTTVKEMFMRAKDIMTRPVHTLLADATVYDAVRLLLSTHVSAAPVVDADGRMIGIVSEADLMHRAELGTQQRHSWLLRLLRDDAADAAEYVRSNTRYVRDIMVSKVVAAGEEATLGEIARLMDEHKVRRIPIVRDGKPVGIVSRANLLQGLLAIQPSSAGPATGDDDIRAAVDRELASHHWGSVWPVNVLVEGGVVHLWGYAPNGIARKACQVAAEKTPGVKRVENHLIVVPDTVSLGI